MTATVLGVRFVLELSALAALGSWGFQRPAGALVKLGLGIGVPVAVAAMWATFIAPEAPISTPSVLRLGLEVSVFGLAAAALAAIRPGLFAWSFALVVVANAALLHVVGEA